MLFGWDHFPSSLGRATHPRFRPVPDCRRPPDTASHRRNRTQLHRQAPPPSPCRRTPPPLLFFSTWRAQAGPRFPFFVSTLCFGREAAACPSFVPPRPRSASQGKPRRHLPCDTASAFVRLAYGIHRRA
jgi:hypothetical protein